MGGADHLVGGLLELIKLLCGRSCYFWHEFGQESFKLGDGLLRSWYHEITQQFLLQLSQNLFLESAWTGSWIRFDKIRVVCLA